MSFLRNPRPEANIRTPVNKRTLAVPRFSPGLGSTGTNGAQGRGLGNCIPGLATPADDDPAIGPTVAWNPAAIQMADLRIGFYESDVHLPATPAVRRVVREAAEVLQDAGARVEEFVPPDVERAWCLYMGLSFADGMFFLQRLLKGTRRDWRIGRLFAFAEVPSLLRPALIGTAACVRSAVFGQGTFVRVASVIVGSPLFRASRRRAALSRPL